MSVRSVVAYERKVVISELAELLAKRSRALWTRKLTVGTCGNASLRVPGHNAVLIKGTGVCMGEMTAADAVLVSLDGDVLMGEHEPSCEVAWHLGIHRMRPDVGAVVHVHPPYATAWTVNNRVPPLLHIAARRALGPVALVDFAPPGSPHLAELIMAAFRPTDVRAALLRQHGIVTVAPDLGTAVHLVDHLEDAAMVAVIAGAVADLHDDRIL